MHSINCDGCRINLPLDCELKVYLRALAPTSCKTERVQSRSPARRRPFLAPSPALD